MARRLAQKTPPARHEGQAARRPRQGHRPREVQLRHQPPGHAARHDPALPVRPREDQEHRHDAAGKMPGFKALSSSASRERHGHEIDGDKLTYTSRARRRTRRTRTSRSGDAGRHAHQPEQARQARRPEGRRPGHGGSEQDAVGRELFYAGDEIVAVAADTEEHAQDALRAIKVEYEVLDHFVKEEDVLKNPNKKTTPGPLPGQRPGRQGSDQGRRRRGLQAKPTRSIEGTYGVPVISHQCLESHGLVAEWDADGGLTVWASTQATVGDRQRAGRAVRSPADQGQVHHALHGRRLRQQVRPGHPGHRRRRAGPQGRGAGQAHARPRRGSHRRPATGRRPTARSRSAATRTARITAFEVDCYGTPGDAGGATVNLGLLPYVYLDAIPNWKRTHSVVRINAGASRAMRAPGHPQNCVLTEFAVDDLAAKLGIDPMQSSAARTCRRTTRRRQEPDRLGRRGATRSTTSRLEIAAKLSEWKEKWHPPGQGKAGTVKHGIGMALHTWGGSRPAARRTSAPSPSAATAP